jgi:hypothetical protein
MLVQKWTKQNKTIGVMKKEPMQGKKKKLRNERR